MNIKKIASEWSKLGQLTIYRMRDLDSDWRVGGESEHEVSEAVRLADICGQWLLSKRSERGEVILDPITSQRVEYLCAADVWWHALASQMENKLRVTTLAQHSAMFPTIVEPVRRSIELLEATESPKADEGSQALQQVLDCFFEEIQWTSWARKAEPFGITGPALRKRVVTHAKKTGQLHKIKEAAKPTGRKKQSN